MAMENDIRPLKTPEERKEALEQALKRVRPQVLGHNDSVNGRLEKFANRTVDEHLKDENHKKKELKPMSLAEMAKYGTDLEKKAEKAGIELGKPGLSKDIEEKQKAKEQEKNKEKEKEKEKDQRKRNDAGEARTKNERNVLQSQIAKRHGNPSGRPELGVGQPGRQTAHRCYRCDEHY